MSANSSVRALVEVAITFFPDYVLTRPDVVASLRGTLEQYLLHHLSLDQARAYIQSAAGMSQPLDRLQEILDMGPEPLPPPDETDQACRGVNHKTRPWSSYEDQRLLCGIFRHGIKNWTAISKFVGNGRTRSQCSQRWYRGLDPSICKEQWSKEEEDKLIALINEHGDKSWTRIASKMGNRSDVQCRYKFKQLQKDRSALSGPKTAEVARARVIPEPPPPASAWPAYPRLAPAPGAFYPPYFPIYQQAPPYIVVPENPPVQTFAYREQPQTFVAPPLHSLAPVVSPPVHLPNLAMANEQNEREREEMLEKEREKEREREKEKEKEKEKAIAKEKERKAPVMSPISMYSIQSPGGILMKPAKEHVTTTVITKSEVELSKSAAARGTLNAAHFDVRMYSVY